jgi:hypothetical protein
MPEYLNQFLADKATMLVRENFTGVDAVWWWERRLGGGFSTKVHLRVEGGQRE